jgi:hypothetical protein
LRLRRRTRRTLLLLLALRLTSTALLLCFLLLCVFLLFLLLALLGLASMRTSCLLHPLSVALLPRLLRLLLLTVLPLSPPVLVRPNCGVSCLHRLSFSPEPLRRLHELEGSHMMTPWGTTLLL